jgi:uncharacterized membrane-anchored protein
VKFYSTNKQLLTKKSSQQNLNTQLKQTKLTVKSEEQQKTIKNQKTPKPEQQKGYSSLNKEQSFP